MLYILENNELIAQPKFVIVKGKTHAPPNSEILRSIGYKDLKKDDMPTVNWCDKIIKNYSQDDTSIYEHYEVVAGSQLGVIHLQNELVKMNEVLENGFSWKDNVVKLSKENQGDYLAAFTMATNAPELFVPMTYTFKDNVKYVMSTVDEIIQFTYAAFPFVSETLETYRTEKDRIEAMTNDEIYTFLKGEQ